MAEVEAVAGGGGKNVVGWYKPGGGNGENLLL